jgi:hypothetical protein
MSGRRFLWLLAITTAALPRAAQPQPPTECRLTETLARCFTRMRDSVVRVSSDVSETQTQVQKATVGAQVASDGLGSAIRDFLPRVAGALFTPGLASDRAALSLRANQTVRFGTVQIGAEFPEPKLFAPLLATVPEANRPAVEERLTSRLEDQDDVIGSVSLNLENRWFGRSVRPHASYVSDALLLILPDFTSAEQQEFDDALSEVFFVADDSLDAARAGDPQCARATRAANRRFDCYRAGFRAMVNTRFRVASAAMRARGARRLSALDALELNALAMLVNNQPQLNATVAYRYRDDLAGPDEVTGSLRFEVGGYNVNTLRKQCPRSRGVDLDRDTPFKACARTALTNMSTRLADALGRGQRFVLEVDLNRRARYDVVLADEGIALADDRSLELDASLGYGQYFGRLAGGTRRPRIDAELSYEHQLEGELRNDRLVAKVAFAHPLTDQLGTVLGAIWANKPEYVGDVQRRLSATLGLTYKLVQREE